MNKLLIFPFFILSDETYFPQHPTASSCSISLCALIFIVTLTAWVSRQQKLLNSMIPTVRHIPRSNAHARLRPYTAKYGRRDRISPYFNGIPGSVLRSYFSVSFTEGYDHFRIQAKFVFKTSLHTIAVQFVRNRSYTIQND